MRVANLIFNNVIGKGSYSTVYSAICEETGNKFAVKVIPKTLKDGNSSQEIYEKEMKAFTTIDNGLFVKFHKSFEDNENYYITMEQCEGGSLKSYIEQNGPLSEDECRKYFVQILAAIEYLHEVNISFGTITAEHILLDENKDIKFAGFGHDHLEDLHYISPEYFKYRTFLKETDIWCLGILLFYMSTKTYPFPCDNIDIAMKKILFTNPVLLPSIPQPLANLISILLTKDADERPSISSLKENLFYSPREYSYIAHKIKKESNQHKMLFIKESNELQDNNDKAELTNSQIRAVRRDNSTYNMIPQKREKPSRRRIRERAFSVGFFSKNQIPSFKLAE